MDSRISLLMLLLLLATACATPMLLDNNLKTEVTIIEVKGRGGGMPGQKIVFGEYFIIEKIHLPKKNTEKERKFRV